MMRTGNSCRHWRDRHPTKSLKFNIFNFNIIGFSEIAAYNKRDEKKNNIGRL